MTHLTIRARIEPRMQSCANAICRLSVRMAMELRQSEQLYHQVDNDLLLHTSSSVLLAQRITPLRI